MKPVEQQIEVLTSKVDKVYQILDRLHQHLLIDGDIAEETASVNTFYPRSEVPKSAAWLIHQDVLLDGDYQSSYQRTETTMSPQSQIQRLTAQLTVAYNRIAALEEQLLSKQRQN
jgi:hypothetical protein